jgi:hypothetical protein
MNPHFPLLDPPDSRLPIGLAELPLQNLTGA